MEVREEIRKFTVTMDMKPEAEQVGMEAFVVRGLFNNGMYLTVIADAVEPKEEGGDAVFTQKILIAEDGSEWAMVKKGKAGRG